MTLNENDKKNKVRCLSKIYVAIFSFYLIISTIIAIFNHNFRRKHFRAPIK